MRRDHRNGDQRQQHQQHDRDRAVDPGERIHHARAARGFDSSSPTATVHGFGGGSDVDFYQFTAAGRLQLSITDNPFTFATIVSLFDNSGRLLAYDDSSTPLKPGSVSTKDSFVGTFTLPGPGTYIAAVTSADASIPNYPDTSSCAGFSQLSRPDGGFGGFATTGCNSTSSSFFANGPQTASSQPYTLQISEVTAAAVPEPGVTSLVGIGFAILALAGLRRKHT